MISPECVCVFMRQSGLIGIQSTTYFAAMKLRMSMILALITQSMLSYSPLVY